MSLAQLLATRRWRYGAAFAGVAVVALALGLAASFGLGGNPFADSGAAQKHGATLLAVALPDTAGREQPLGQWRGKVVVVNFWATWCAPCREEMPEFVQLQDELGGKGLQFVGIAIDQADKVSKFSTELGLNYPALIGGYGAMELAKTLGDRLGVLPFTLIIDRTGRIVHTQVGPLGGAKLREIVGHLL